jgi:hypothetical protein
MAHSLRFTPSGEFYDRSAIEDAVRSYVEHSKMDVSDMLDFVLDPIRPDRLEALADWAADFGSRDDLYDIGKFGFWDCEDCGEEELDVWSFRSDCDEDEDEDEE